MEYGSKGILPIAIHPGGVLTQMATGVPEEYKSLMEDTAELAADFVVWLTKERKEWLSGRYISCKWDAIELEGKKYEIVEGDNLKVRMAV